MCFGIGFFNISFHVTSVACRLFIVVLFSCGSLTGAAENKALHRVNVMAFPGAFNWPIWAAQGKGFFSENGLEVELAYTRSSIEQFTSIMAGQQDIIMTAIDNVVAYRDGFGEVEFEKPPDVFVFMGGDNGFLSLIVQPDVKTFADLEGRQVAVDAMTTGYAFVLRKLLQEGGVDEQKLEFVSVGGALQRFRAMMGGQYAGSVLMTPFDIMAEAEGFSALSKAINVIGDYQGVVGAARQGWADRHPHILIRYISAYRESLAWLYDRSNKSEAIAILRANLPQLPEKFSEAIYQTVLADEGGLERGANLNPLGLETVLRLRKEFGSESFLPGSIERYYNPLYFESAVESGQSANLMN